MTGWHPFLSLNGYVTRVPVAGVTCSREKTSTWNSHASTHSCLGYPFDRILLLFLSFFFLPSISRLYPFHHCHNKLLLVVLFLPRSLNLVSFSSYSLQPRVSLLLDTTRRSFLPVKIPPSLLMSLCFSYSISSSFTSTKGCLLFSTASNCTLPSPRSSPSSSSVSQLVSSSTSFVLSSTSSFGHGNISVEICHQFLTTFSTLLLKFFRYLALPIRRSIFLTLDTLKNFQSSNPISVTFATLRFDFSVDFSLVCHTYTCL